MSIVTQCTATGCKTLTVGPLCIEHELPQTKEFVRGRPAPNVIPSAPVRIPLYSVAVGSHVRELRKASAQRAAVRALR